MVTRPQAFIAVALGLMLFQPGCSAPSLSKPIPGAIAPNATLAEPSMTSKVTGSIKKGAGAVAAFVTPKPSKGSDSPRKPIKPDEQLYITMAQLQERAGQLDKAAAEYEKALKEVPNSLPALVGYAHLEDRRGDLEAATKLYQRATASHPKEVAPLNDLGLCFHRRGMLPDAARTLSRAVELRPDRQLYRNNLAIVLVDMGKIDDAMAQLTTAQGVAVAHYNVGCLLARKGNDRQAIEHFQKALAHDPSLAAAQDWIARLAPQAPAEGPQVTAQVAPQVSAVAPQVSAPAPQVTPAPAYATSNWNRPPQSFQPAPEQIAPPLPPAYTQPQQVVTRQEVAPAQPAAPVYGVKYPKPQPPLAQAPYGQLPPSPGNGPIGPSASMPSSTINR